MAEKSGSSSKFIRTSLAILVTIAILFVLKVSRDVAVPIIFAFFCFLLFSRCSDVWTSFTSPPLSQ